MEVRGREEYPVWCGGGGVSQGRAIPGLKGSGWLKECDQMVSLGGGQSAAGRNAGPLHGLVSGGF